MRVIHKAAVLGATVVALAGISMGTALADPYSTPAATSIVGVGSDTTTPLFDGRTSAKDTGTLVTDYNATSPANPLWSWDATGSPASIVTKSTCPSITRPNGSSAGITALENNTLVPGTSDYCIDFARSSRGPASTDPNTLTFVSLATDGIAWSSPAPGTGQTSPVPATLSIAQQAAIYTCTDTNWNQVGGANAPIVAVLPQSGSGTRSTYLLKLGGGTTPLTPGACVVNGSNTTGPIEENTGSSSSSFGNTAQFDPSGVPAVDDIFPYSIGDYIAQGTAGTEGTYNSKNIGGKATLDFAQGVLKLRNMSSTTGGTSYAPITVSNTAPYSNGSQVDRFYPIQRTLYDVVRNGTPGSGFTFPKAPAYEATALPAIFGSKGWTCTNATAQTDIAVFGFKNLGALCGSLTGN